MDYQTSYVLSWIGMVLAVICLALGEMATGTAKAVLFWISVALMLLTFVQEMIWYRCPNCKRSLNIRGGMPKFCPKCGTQLGITADDEDDE